MDEAAVRAFWSPSPPALTVTSVAVDDDRAWVYTGGSDGSIVRWQLGSSTTPKAAVMLVGHTRPILHFATGLADGSCADGAAPRHLLSVDDSGCCCLWLEPSGRCLLQRRIPQLAKAVFGQAPPQGGGSESFGAGRLLAALPSHCTGPLAHPAHPQYHPVGGGGTSAAPDGTAIGNDGDAVSNALLGGRLPALLVLDWRRLAVMRVLPMQPLQQLVSVDMAAVAVAAAAAAAHLSGNEGLWPPSRRASGFGDADSTEDCSENSGAGGLLCLQWDYCAAAASAVSPPPTLQALQQQLGAVRSGDDGASNCGGSSSSSRLDAVTNVLAVAVTPDGTLYGCLVPDNANGGPTSRVLKGTACGEAWRQPVGLAPDYHQQQEHKCHHNQQQQQRWQLEHADHEQQPLEVHEPLLATTLSSDLRWALLGAVDAWIVLEAQRSVIARVPASPGAGRYGSTGSAASLPLPQPLQVFVRLQYTSRCRINLMHQLYPSLATLSDPGLVRSRPQVRRVLARVAAGSSVWGASNDNSCLSSGSELEPESGNEGHQQQHGDSSPLRISSHVRAQSHVAATAVLAAAASRQQGPGVVRASAHLLLLNFWEEEQEEKEQQDREEVVRPLEEERVREDGGELEELLAAAAGSVPVLPSPPPPPAFLQNDGTALGGQSTLPGTASDALHEVEIGIASSGGDAGEPVCCSGGSASTAAAGSVSRGTFAGDVELASGTLPGLARLSFAVYLGHNEVESTSSSSSLPAQKQLMQLLPNLQPLPSPLEQDHQQQVQQRTHGTGASTQRSEGVRGGGFSPGLTANTALAEGAAQQYDSHDVCYRPPTHHDRHRNHHHYHHLHRRLGDGSACTRRALTVLQVLGWDGAGRQQVVSLTTDGRVLAVRELQRPQLATSHASNTSVNEHCHLATHGNMAIHGSLPTPPYLCPPPWARPGLAWHQSFCCFLSGKSTVAASGSLAGWVVVVHGYQQNPVGPATASVLQWPLPSTKFRSYQKLRSDMDAEEVVRDAASIPAARKVPQAVVLANGGHPAVGVEEEAIPLVGSLCDGWSGSAAKGVVGWRVQRTSRHSRHALRHVGRCVLECGAAVATRGPSWKVSGDEHHRDGGGGGGHTFPSRCTTRYGGVVSGSSAETVISDIARDDIAHDAEADQLRRRVSNDAYDMKMYPDKECAVPFSDCAIWSDTAATTTTTTAAMAVDGCRVGRSRRDAYGNSGVPACLQDRWIAASKFKSSGSGSGLTGSCNTIAAEEGSVFQSGPDIGRSMAATGTSSGGGEGEGRSSAAASNAVAGAATLVSSSILRCDGTAAGEAVVLHCTTDGSMHYCDVGAYTVPAVYRAPPPTMVSPPPALSSPSLSPQRPSLLVLQQLSGGAHCSGSTVCSSVLLPVSGPPACTEDLVGCTTIPNTTTVGPIACHLDNGRRLEKATEVMAEIRPYRAGSMYGHVGPVTCQLEVVMAAPDPDPGGTASAAAAAASPSAPSAFSRHLGGEANQSAAEAAVFGDGPVRVLLTGGFDGSLRGWHTHAAAFGRPVFALHPHGGPVARVMLPHRAEALAPPEFRQCVVSAAEDGSVALVCLERGCVVRVCRTYPYGTPQVVSWSFRRGFLACGGRDPMGQWVVAVFDLAPAAPSLDRLLVGAEAAAVLNAANPTAAFATAVEAAAAESSDDGVCGNSPAILNLSHWSLSAWRLQGTDLNGSPPYSHMYSSWLPPPSALISVSSSSPFLAPVSAYSGSLRTLYCHRPDVVLAVIDSEALLMSLADYVTIAPSLSPTTAGGSEPIPVPRKPVVAAAKMATRESGSARANSIQPPYGLSTTPGFLSPFLLASPNLPPLLSPGLSRRDSVDLAPTAAVNAAAVSQDNSPVAAPLQGMLAAPERRSRSASSRFSLEAYGNLGGACAGNGQRTLEEPASIMSYAAHASAADVSVERALATLISALHMWTSDSLVDRAVASGLLELGLLSRGDGKIDPWVSGDGRALDYSCGPRLGQRIAVAAETEGPVLSLRHRAHSAPPGRTCSCRGSTLSGAPSCGLSYVGSEDVDISGLTAVAAAAGGLGLAAESNTHGGIRIDTAVEAPRPAPPPRHCVPHPTVDDEPYELYGGPDVGPCLVQAALVSPCGSVAMAMPQASPQLHGSSAPSVVGDPFTSAVRLLHLVALSGALLRPKERKAAIPRAAVHAASQVRHLSLVTARDAMLVERASHCAGTAIPEPPPVEARAAAGSGVSDTSLAGKAVSRALSAAPLALSLLNLDLAVFARQWLAADPWIREAAQLLLAAYTKPISSCDSITAVTSSIHGVRCPHDVPQELSVTASPLQLPSQVTELLQLRAVLPSRLSRTSSACPPEDSQQRRGVSRSPFSQLPPLPPLPPPPPQRLYPAVIITSAACLAHPDAMPRQLFAAAAESLMEMLFLPLTLSKTSSAPGGTALESTSAVQPSGSGELPNTPPAPQQAASVGLWADGKVLLPELAAAMLTVGLRGARAELWGQALQPWKHFVDRLVHLAHVIPLPPPGLKTTMQHVDAASLPGRAHGPRGHAATRPPSSSSPPPPSVAYPPPIVSTPQRAARQLADRAVGLLAATASLDMDTVLGSLSRFEGGEPLPLHPVVAAALTRLAASRTGRCRLAAAAPALGGLLARCAAAPATRSRPDLARPAYLAAADLAATVPCAALHVGTMQLAVASPLAAAASPSGEPQFITVYNLENGNTTWQLPLQAGRDALHSLTPTAAVALGTAAAAIGGGPAVGVAAATSASVGKPATHVPSVSLLPDILRAVAHAGVAALQFSPQGDQLAVLAVDGAPLRALLVYSLHLPWSHKLLTLSGALRPALVMQPCHCWLLSDQGQPQPPLSPKASKPPHQLHQVPPSSLFPQRSSGGGLSCLDVGREAEVEVVQRSRTGSPIQRLADDVRKLGAEGGRGSGVEWAPQQGEVQQATEGLADAGLRRQGQGGRVMDMRQESEQATRLGRVVDRVLGLRWSGQSCVEVLQNRTVVVARFVLPVG